MFKKFLEAAARGWTFAAEQPEAAAELLSQLAAAENPGLPMPLEPEMVRESQAFIAQVRHSASIELTMRLQGRTASFSLL